MQQDEELNVRPAIDDIRIEGELPAIAAAVQGQIVAELAIRGVTPFLPGGVIEMEGVQRRVVTRRQADAVIVVIGFRGNAGFAEGRNLSAGRVVESLPAPHELYGPDFGI